MFTAELHSLPAQMTLCILCSKMTMNACCWHSIGNKRFYGDGGYRETLNHARENERSNTVAPRVSPKTEHVFP